MKFHWEGAEILVSIHSFKTKGTFCVIGRYGQAPAQHPEQAGDQQLLSDSWRLLGTGRSCEWSPY